MTTRSFYPKTRSPIGWSASSWNLQFGNGLSIAKLLGNRSLGSGIATASQLDHSPLGCARKEQEVTFLQAATTVCREQTEELRFTIQRRSCLGG